jgi:hypothetical protein
MPKFMQPETALARLVDDEGAPVAARVQALRQLAHPPLCMLRRLLHRSRTEPSHVPSRLLAVATLAYAKEVALRKIRPAKHGSKADGRVNSGNALGI